MDDIRQLLHDVEHLQSSLETFTEAPTKAESKRIRLMLGELKKQVTDYRSILVELDQEGY